MRALLNGQPARWKICRTISTRWLKVAVLRKSTAAGGCVGRLAKGLEVVLYIVAPADYIAALHYRTGSREHYAALEDLACSKGISIGADGLKGPKGKQLKIASEGDIYRRLGLKYIAPELRENEGEIEAASNGSLLDTVLTEDIQGMVHCHTTYSDGQNTIEEMALAAEAMGMRYITITDHSPNAFYAGGVKIDRLRAQGEEIDRVQERVQIKLLKGTESDILEDGLLDYPDYILEKFDVIIASIHARYKMSADQMTGRLLRVMKLLFFKIWGHPLGRLIQSRPPFECRREEVLDGVATSRAAIEVNGDPVDWTWNPTGFARRAGGEFDLSSPAMLTRLKICRIFPTAWPWRGAAG
ncbi:MAG: PHP domain-containing protein [Candidatus Binatia bacterium]